MSLANYITLFRILLTPFFFTSLLSYESGKEYHRWVAFGIFLAASLTDALDGFLARIMKRRTALGRFLDPFADKLLLLTGYLGLLFVDALPYRPPPWVTVTIVFHDIVIIAGLVGIYITTGKVTIQPNFLGKCTTVMQMTTLVAILLKRQIAVVFWYVTAVLTIVSCLNYVLREARKIKTA